MCCQETDMFLNWQKEPDRKHTVTDDTVLRFRELVSPILCWNKTGSYGWDVEIEIHHAKQRGHTLVINKGNESQRIPMNLDNFVKGIHTIDMELNGYRFRVCEHILGILYGYNIYGSEIHIRTKSFDSSWPTENTSAWKYAQNIYEKSQEIEAKPAFFTVPQATKINFNNRRNSFIVLIPNVRPHQKTTFDVNIDYPQPSIWGGRRVVYERGDINTLRETIAYARTNARWWRRSLLRAPRFLEPIVKSLPIIWQEIPFWIQRGSVMEINQDTISHPNERFFSWDESPSEYWSELWYHELLDKMWAEALLLSWDLEGRDFMGRMFFYKTSHEDDVALKVALQEGLIETIPVE